MKQAETQTHNYTVKGIKSFMGMDCPGFNATLYRDGIKVAFVINEGSGGCCFWDFTNKDEETRLIEFCKTLPHRKYNTKTFEDDPNGDGDFEIDMDSFICQLIDEYENAKRFARLCKTKVLFRIKGDTEGNYRVIKHTYDNACKEYLAKTYGDKIIEVLNDRYQQ